MSEKSTTPGREEGTREGGGKDEAKWRSGSRENESESGNAGKLFEAHRRIHTLSTVREKQGWTVPINRPLSK